MPGYRDATRAETMELCVAHVAGASDDRSSGSNAAVGHGRSLEPNAATQPSTLLSDARLRAEIDAGAQDVVDALVNAGGGGRAAAAGTAEADGERPSGTGARTCGSAGAS